MHLWQRNTWALHFNCWSDDLGFPTDNHLSSLIATLAVKANTMPLCFLTCDGDSYGNRITDDHRMMKSKCLPQINRSWTWQHSPQHGGDQGCSPHTMSNNCMKHVATCVFLIAMSGVDIT